MKTLIGIAIVIGCVLGGFILSHGVPPALWQALELLIIGSAAFGAFVITNPGNNLKTMFASIPALLKGSRYNKAMYMDLPTP